MVTWLFPEGDCLIDVSLCILTKSVVFTTNLKPCPSHTDRAIAQSIRQGLGVKLSLKDQVRNLLFGSLICFCRPLISNVHILNSGLELAYN